MQAEAFSDIKVELADVISEFSAQYATKQDFQLLEERLENKLNALESRLTWRFIALTAFLGTILSLINILAA